LSSGNIVRISSISCQIKADDDICPGGDVTGHDVTEKPTRSDIICAALGTSSAFRIEYTKSYSAILTTKEMSHKRMARQSSEELRVERTQYSETDQAIS
jgi:hypothetical protein